MRYGDHRASPWMFLVALVAIFVLWFTFRPFSSAPSAEEVASDRFIQMIEDGVIGAPSVKITKGDEGIISIEGERLAGGKVKVSPNIDTASEVYTRLINEGLYGKLEKKGGGFGSFVWVFLPTIVFFALIYFFVFRRAGESGNSLLKMDRDVSRMVTRRPGVTFNDVAGQDEAKQELQEIVEFLRAPEKFLRVGARIPKGVLLVGQPGTGKTLFAKAVAGEAGASFFSMGGSEFVEMFVGMGASRVRGLFSQAKRNAPAIIFIDEIDAVGRHRGTGLGGGHDEREQTLNQILAQMDGFEENPGIVVLAATNRPDVLDPALLRPGRFDRQIRVDMPDLGGREEVLNVHVKGKPISEEVNIKRLAKQTAGFSGADLANLVNEAAILAARDDRVQITEKDFEEAIDRVIAGPARKSHKVSDEEKEIIAYHEAGHAVAAWKMKYADPVHKISVVQRAGMGGYTRTLPEEERGLQDKAYFLDLLCVLLGGRASEELKFKPEHVTTGACNDIERATMIARKMVTEFGMSDKLGTRTFGQKHGPVFLGRDFAEQKDYSEATAREIDKEIGKLVASAKERVTKVLQQNQAKIKEVAAILLEQETLEGDILHKVLPPTLA